VCKLSAFSNQPSAKNKKLIADGRWLFFEEEGQFLCNSLLRCLKRRVSDAVFRSLVAGSQAPSCSAT